MYTAYEESINRALLAREVSVGFIGSVPVKSVLQTVSDLANRGMGTNLNNHDVSKILDVPK